MEERKKQMRRKEPTTTTKNGIQFLSFSEIVEKKEEGKEKRNEMGKKR